MFGRLAMGFANVRAGTRVLIYTRRYAVLTPDLTGIAESQEQRGVRMRPARWALPERGSHARRERHPASPRRAPASARELGEERREEASL